MDSKYLEYMTELELQVGFTLEELKKKKIELVKEYHPDKYNNQSERMRKLAEEKMKKINEAYDYLEKNFNQNSSGSYNSNEGNDSDYYNDYDDYEEEDNYNRGDYYFLNEDEELNFFGKKLPILKRELEQHITILSAIFYQELEKFDFSDPFELKSAIDTTMGKFANTGIEFFLSIIKGINKVKSSDINYLNTLGRVKLKKINKAIDEEYNEINRLIFSQNFQDTTYIQLMKCRFYTFIEDLSTNIEEKLIPYFNNFTKTLEEIENVQAPFFVDIVEDAKKSEIKREANKLFNNLGLVFFNYSNIIFKILKKVIYLGISDYDASALLAESHYKANTDPAFRLVFYGNTDQNLRSILNLFPNEVNNVLIKLYLLYKEGKKEEIEKLSTEIIKIQNDEYFSNIIEVIYKDFKEKKDSFFINIQLLFNKENKNKLLESLKKIPKQLEEDIDLSFWGKNKENEDFQLLMKKYDFINKNENKSFIEKGNLLVNEILSKYNNLKKVLEENKKLEDLIEVYEYFLSLKENEKIFNFYRINKVREEKEVKKEAYELSDFFIKSLNTLKSMKEKFLKSKNFPTEDISLKELIKEIEINIRELKPLALRRKKNYEELANYFTKESLQSVVRAYENMTKFFEELANF
ncbi:MAG: J domain-containing protein [Fusobacterium periodonticum]|jgi:putative dnaJ domain protein|nr:J domain-containing protein [Fusobacterium periodonticum]